MLNYSFGKLTNSSGTLTNPFQYTGRELDSETGLYYYRARYYDPSTGRFISEDPTEFDGGINFYRYAANSPTNFIDPLGLAEYDARGNRTVVTDALSNQTSFAYDMGNRLTGITYPDSSTASFTYDITRTPHHSDRPERQDHHYAYDDADRLTSVTDPAGNVTQYTYDTENNLLSITDANNNTTNFTYDAFGRVTQTTFPSNYFETYAYDADNNLTSKTDRKGDRFSMSYDALNRLAAKTYPDSTSADYTYDLGGQDYAGERSDGDVRVRLRQHGAADRDDDHIFVPDGTPFTNSYTYDADSNRTGFTAPDSSTNTYTYDTLNRLTHAGEFLGRVVRVQLRRAEPPDADDAAQRRRHELHLRQVCRGCSRCCTNCPGVPLTAKSYTVDSAVETNIEDG